MYRRNLRVGAVFHPPPANNSFAPCTSHPNTKSSISTAKRKLGLHMIFRKHLRHIIRLLRDILRRRLRSGLICLPLFSGSTKSTILSSLFLQSPLLTLFAEKRRRAETWQSANPSSLLTNISFSLDHYRFQAFFQAQLQDAPGAQNPDLGVSFHGTNSRANDSL